MTDGAEAAAEATEYWRQAEATEHGRQQRAALQGRGMMLGPALDGAGDAAAARGRQRTWARAVPASNASWCNSFSLRRAVTAYARP